MNNIDYSIMDETVDKICESLLSEPDGWSFDTFDITSPEHLGSIKIEIGLQNTFTKIRTKGTHCDTVFSYNQGRKIADSYYKALSINGSKAQQKILSKLSNARKQDESFKYESQKINEKINYKCIFIFFLFCMSISLLIFNK